jgi:IS5 family transposase
MRPPPLRDWTFLDKQLGAVYRDGPGQPPLPNRLMAGLAILKHTHDLSDEMLCARWLENRILPVRAA